MAARKKTRKTTPKRRSNKQARTSAASAPASAAEAIRDRFETRIDDVRTRFRSFEKDWSKAVDGLVSRGRTAEKDLRKRLDKVTKDLKKSPLVTRVKKNPAYKKVTNGGLLDAVKKVNYEKAFKDLRREVKGFQDEVGDFFQTSASRVKQAVDLPSRTDFDRLNRKIENLSSQVRSLETKRKKR